MSNVNQQDFDGKSLLMPIKFAVTHNKSGNTYYVFSTTVINSTNSASDEIMVLYTDVKGTKLFSRNSKEFYEKFTPISNNEEGN